MKPRKIETTSIIPSDFGYLKFLHRDGTEEIQEHRDIREAWDAFRMFCEPQSSDIYAHVAICDGDHRVLCVMVFLENVV